MKIRVLGRAKLIRLIWWRNVFQMGTLWKLRWLPRGPGVVGGMAEDVT